MLQDKKMIIKFFKLDCLCLFSYLLSRFTSDTIIRRCMGRGQKSRRRWNNQIFAISQPRHEDMSNNTDNSAIISFSSPLYIEPECF